MNLIDEANSTNNASILRAQIREQNDKALIHGYVTVIKNAGKANEEIIMENEPNLLTTAGIALFHAQCYSNTSAGTRGCGFIAVTTDATSEVVGDTSLTSEITTGGLGRSDADTKSTTANVTTITHTFTASGTHTNIAKAGLFNASSGVTMAHVRSFSATVTLVSSDTLQVTWTLTLG